MIKRWQGNSGRVQHLPEAGDSAHRQVHRTAEQSPRPQPQKPLSPQPRMQGGFLPGLEGITRLLPGKLEALETEDIILLLILYLMYRESGDSELLMIMGAMFLL